MKSMVETGRVSPAFVTPSTPARTVRVMLVEDHPIMRIGIAALMATRADLESVAQAGTGEEAVVLHEKHQPDVTLMDLRLPGMSGVETILAIRRKSPKARFIVLTTYEGDEDIHQRKSRSSPLYRRAFG